MSKITDWMKEQTLETKALLVFALVLGIWVAVPKKPKADGTVLKVLQLDGISYKIEKGYSTSKSINIELEDGSTIVLTEYKITPEGVVTKIKN